MYSDKKIAKYFKKARLMSEISEHPKTKIGAVLVYKNKIISVGFNQQKSNPTQKEYNMCRVSDDDRKFDVDKCSNGIHAELSAILSANKAMDLSECSIFIYRKKKTGQQGLCKPCKACQQLLKDNGIKNWYYTLDNGWRYERKEF